MHSCEHVELMCAKIQGEVVRNCRQNIYKGVGQGFLFFKWDFIAPAGIIFMIFLLNDRASEYKLGRMTTLNGFTRRLLYILSLPTTEHLSLHPIDTSAELHNYFDDTGGSSVHDRHNLAFPCEFVGAVTCIHLYLSLVSAHPFHCMIILQ